jgi:hypothetical protein
MGNTPPAILAGPKHLPPIMSEAFFIIIASDIFYFFVAKNHSRFSHLHATLKEMKRHR